MLNIKHFNSLMEQYEASENQGTFADFLNESTVLGVDKRVREFDKLKNKYSEEEATKRLESILKDYQEVINKTLKDFENIVKKEIPREKTQVKFLSGSKPLKSIISKVIARGRSLAGLGDMVRGAVLFRDQRDLDKFIKDFKRKYSKYIIEYDAKEKGGDPTYGYFGSHHFGLSINGLTVELQAMTQKLWNYKGAAHDIYTKTRESGVVTKADVELSKRIFSIGNTSRRVNEDTADDDFVWYEIA